MALQGSSQRYLIAGCPRIDPTASHFFLFGVTITKVPEASSHQTPPLTCQRARRGTPRRTGQPIRLYMPRGGHPANTIRRPNAGLMLGRRRRRRSNNKPALG